MRTNWLEFLFKQLVLSVLTSVCQCPEKPPGLGRMLTVLVALPPSPNCPPPPAPTLLHLLPPHGCPALLYYSPIVCPRQQTHYINCTIFVYDTWNTSCKIYFILRHQLFVTKIGCWFLIPQIFGRIN